MEMKTSVHAVDIEELIPIHYMDDPFIPVHAVHIRRIPSQDKPRIYNMIGFVISAAHKHPAVTLR